MDSELQLVPNFDPPCVCILQASCQGLGQIQHARKLIALGRLINYFQVVVLVQLVFVVDYRPRSFVGIANRIRVFWVEGEVVCFDQLRDNLSNPETLQERDQLEVNADARAEDDSLGRRANRVLDFVWPDVFDRL